MMLVDELRCPRCGGDIPLTAKGRVQCEYCTATLLIHGNEVHPELKEGEYHIFELEPEPLVIGTIPNYREEYEEHLTQMQASEVFSSVFTGGLDFVARWNIKTYATYTLLIVLLWTCCWILGFVFGRLNIF